MTNRTKRRSLLSGIIVFWLCVLAVLIASTADALAEQNVRITMPDGTVVKATIEEEPVPYQKTYDLMNGLTAGQGNYVRSIDGYPVWIPRTPYGPGIRTRP